MKHSKSELAAISRIKNIMKECGLYERRYDIQIEQTAENMCDIDDMKTAIKREGKVIDELKTAGIGTKRIPHPLIVPMQNAQALLVRQLSALGLNKMQEKKSEAKEARKEEKDGVEKFYGQQ